MKQEKSNGDRFMYFDNLNAEDNKIYHDLIKSNFRILLIDALSSNLFNVTEIIESELYRLVPLFNYDVCISSGENDKILDNRCLLCIYNEDTVLTFESGISFTEYDYLIKIKSLNNKRYVNILFYDEITLMNINNVEINVEELDLENNILETGRYYSNIKGSFIYCISNEECVKIVLKCNYSNNNKTINIEVD